MPTGLLMVPLMITSDGEPWSWISTSVGPAVRRIVKVRVTIGAPGFVSDTTGGGSITVTVPADPRIVETLIYVADTSSGLFFTIGPLTGTGVLNGTLPDKLGACSGQGCQNGPNATQSLSTGDSYTIYAISYDYPAFEASPPGSTSQLPVIVGSSGQADISMSQLTNGTY